MAFIRYEDEFALAPGDHVPDPDNILQIHRVHPAVMRQHYELYLELMHRPGPLTRRQREMLAVRVSVLNGCHYWLTHHAAGLRRLLDAAGVSSADQTDRLAVLTAQTLDSAGFAPPDRALLAYAEKLTQAPATMTEADVAPLRDAGFDDRAIHDACAIVAYFAFVNRIADGLGVDIETP